MKIFFLIVSSIYLTYVYGQIDESEYFDVFENDFPEWRIAFRGTKDINKPVYDAYMTSQTASVEDGCKKPPRVGESCANHYRNNDVFDHWSNIDQVAFVVYKDSQRVAHIVFDGKGSDTTSWFKESRIISSTWTDIKTDHTKNYFGISGEHGGTTLRRFYINKLYHGCPDDVGWFAAIDTLKVACSWETFPNYPKFLYAAKDVETNWTTGDVGQADDIVVFVKYEKSTSIGK